MSEQHDNPPAFPLPLATALDGSIYNSAEQSGYSGGMSLRDYFAAKAMNQTLADWLGAYEGLTVDSEKEIPHHRGRTFADQRREQIQGAAKDAYAIADAMLAARKESANA